MIQLAVDRNIPLTYLDNRCIICLDNLGKERYHLKVEKSLLSGSTPLLLLALLRDRDMYGYEMVTELAKRSDDTFQLKEGTLYPLLHAMEKNKWVSAYTSQTPSGRERKYYHLTSTGRVQLVEKEEEWKVFSEKVNLVLGFAGA